MTEMIISKVSGNDFNYKGWNVTHWIMESSCECCDPKIKWSASIRKETFISSKEYETLEELFNYIDTRESM